MRKDDEATRWAADLERRCRHRWLVVYLRYHRLFEAFPMYDMSVSTTVTGASPHEVWQRIVEIDHTLIGETS